MKNQRTLSVLALILMFAIAATAQHSSIRLSTFAGPVSDHTPSLVQTLFVSSGAGGTVGCRRRSERGREADMVVTNVCPVTNPSCADGQYPGTNGSVGVLLGTGSSGARCHISGKDVKPR